MTVRFFCVGTHHKTGTVWMRKFLHDISRDQNIPLMQCYRPKKLAQAAETGPQIIVNWSSTFPSQLMDMDHARFLHVIRDPRDVLLSGMRYHLVAPLGNEKFLRETKPEWGGKNYKEYINSLPSEVDRLLFEMENKHDKTIREMLIWPYGHERAIDVRYEDLIEDTDCRIMRDTLSSFAIEGLDIDRAMQSFWDQSLFGGLANNADQSYLHKVHVSSGSVSQWKYKLPLEVAKPYAERYGDALKTLGYAKDDSWVEECIPAGDLVG